MWAVGQLMAEIFLNPMAKVLLQWAVYTPSRVMNVAGCVAAKKVISDLLKN